MPGHFQAPIFVRNPARIVVPPSGATTNQSLTANVTVAASFTNQVGKTLTGTVTVTATFLKQIAHTLTVTTVTVAATIAKQISKTLSATTVTVAASLTRPVTRAQTLTASTVTVTATIRRQINKTLAASTVTVAASFSRIVARTMTATVTVTAAITRSIQKTLAATGIAVAATVTKQVAHRLSATVTVTATLAAHLVTTFQVVMNVTVAVGVRTIIRCLNRFWAAVTTNAAAVNLVPNWNFESAFAGSWQGANATVTQDTTHVYEEVYAAKIVTTGGVQNGLDSATTKVPVTGSKNYTATAWAYSAAGQVRMILDQFNSSNVFIGSFHTNDVTMTGVWTQLSVSFTTVPTAATLRFRLWTITEPVPYTFWVDQVAVYQTDTGYDGLLPAPLGNSTLTAAATGSLALAAAPTGSDTLLAAAANSDTLDESC